MKILGAPRVAHRVGRFVASADRRRGQLCIVCNLPAVHLKIVESCSNKRSHFLQHHRQTRIDGAFQHLCARDR